MNFTFERPIGAVADTNELEYIAALHQDNDDEDFLNASIDASDVKNFLLSRYGVDITEEQVRKEIFAGLAGGDDEESCLDITEIVAILLIPFLLKSSNSDTVVAIASSENFVSEAAYKTYLEQIEARNEMREENESIFRDVLKIILTDVTGSNKPVELTPALIHKFFERYDEHELIEDKTLIDKMIHCATGGKPGGLLDEESFVRALTGDVTLYNIYNESKPTTLFDDLQHLNEDGKTIIKQDEGDEEIPHDKEKTVVLKKVNRRFNFPHLDLLSNQFRSQTQLLMSFVIVIVWIYVYFSGKMGRLACDHNDTFGCRVGNSVLGWLVILGLLVGIVAPIIVLLNLGNNPNRGSVWEVLVSIMGIGLAVFAPIFTKKWDLLSLKYIGYENLGTDRKICLIFTLVLGGCLFIIQILNLIRILMPKYQFTKNKFVAHILGGSIGKESFQSKQAATHKVHELVKHAVALHKPDESSKNSKSSSNKTALIQYTKTSDDFEVSGGFFWFWKQFFSENSTLASEGITVNTRLKVGNAAQLFFLVIVLFNTITTSVYVMKQDIFWKRLVGVKSGNISDVKCPFRFDPEECYFPNINEQFYIGSGICPNIQSPSEDCFEELSETDLSTAEGDYTIDEIYQFACEQILVEEILDPVAYLYSEFRLNVEDILRDDVQVMPCYQFQDLLSFIDQASSSSTTCDLLGSLTNIDLSLCRDDFGSLLSSDYQLDNVTANSVFDLFSAPLQEFIDTNFGSTDLAVMVNTPLNLTGQVCLGSFDITAVGNFVVDVIDGIDNFAQAFNCSRDIQLSYHPDASAFTKTSTEANICRAPMQACIGTSESNVCLVGMRGLLPWNFTGDECNNHEDISNLLAYKTRLGIVIEQVVESINDFLPRKWTLTFALAVGVFVAVAVYALSAVTIVPSALMTTWKFRSGFNPSLRDGYFKRYRANMFDVCNIIGVIFWSPLLGAVLFFLLVTSITFIVVWHVTWPYILLIIGLLVGIVVTVVIRMLLIKIFGSTTFAGFYRTRPVFANVFTIAVECWSLATTSITAISRIGKMVAVLFIFMGRIDTPILSKDLSIIDPFPQRFTQTILAAEAHRHPYLERLGMMYMMKLRCGEHFGTHEGSTWRLLFVFALMPWLRKYRIYDLAFDSKENDDELFKKMVEQAEEKEKEFARHESFGQLGADMESMTGLSVEVGDDDASSIAVEDPTNYKS